MSRFLQILWIAAAFGLATPAQTALVTAWYGSSAQPQADTRAPQSPECMRLNQNALGQVARGVPIDAQTKLSATLDNSVRLDQVCAGLIMNNVAAFLLAAGRLADAERMAARSVRALEQSLSPTDLALLRPLQILTAVQFE